jgi:tripartite-type tricarboxylate transporter receptor subunit TctC
MEAPHRAAPDGYMLAVPSTSFIIGLHTAKVPYNLSDCTPVALLAKVPDTLMVGSAIPGWP